MLEFLRRAPAVVEIVFAVHPPDPDGRHWVTVATGGGLAMPVGYVQPYGEGVAAHGADEGWPRIDVYADSTRAVSAVIGEWGRHAARSVEPGQTPPT